MMKTLTDWWNGRGAADTAPIIEYTGPVKRVRSPRHVRATIRLPEGVGYKDLVKTTSGSNPKELIEAAAGWPPGSMVISPNMDDASLVDAILADPRILRKPVPWEGPSWTGGASIADSISIGMYQDGTECEVEIPATQIQVMGQVGSGKSLGGAWNALAEMITRPDCIVWGIDIKKGMQTLGPLESALHRIATTPAEAIDLLTDANNLITPRTNFLSSDGLGKWYRGCKIKYLVLWIEEAPFVMNELGSKGIKAWTETVKAARSAGITVAWSLQRADFKEIPTVARGQATKWCFGVQTQREANLGLSAIQKDRGCTPQIWGQRRPGMSYIDAPNIPESLVSMPLRAWWWGENASILRAHAERFPATDRLYDDLMEEYFEAKAKGDVTVSKFLSDMRPVETTVIDVKVDDIPDGSGEGAKRPSKPAPIPGALNKRERGELGRKLFATVIESKRGQIVSKDDFVEIMESLNLTPRWIYLQLDNLVRDGKAAKIRDGRSVTWEIKPDATV